MTAGRPFKWQSVEEIEGIINDYFQNTPDEEITLTGLCLALGTNKQTLANYQGNPDFKDVIETAKLRIENAYERSLRKNGRSGDIFALKNFGWTDRQEIDHSGTLTLNSEVQKEIQETFLEEQKAHHKQ